MPFKRSFEESNIPGSPLLPTTEHVQIPVPMLLEAQSTPSSPKRAISQLLSSRSGSERPSSTQIARTSLLTRRAYAPDASIVLVGIRGTGKSSLAVITASALEYRIVDADQQFYQITGKSRASFRSTHGVREYKHRELEVMHSILFGNQSKCVIICGPGSVEGEGQELLRDYAKTHPIIYVLRDTKDIHRHLRLWDAKTISHLVELSGPSYRASTTFEFYNVSEYASPCVGKVNQPGRISPPSLTLKGMERDFLQLIYSITRQADRSNEHEARHVLSLLPPESRHFTYALSLPLSTLARAGDKLNELDSTADAVELIMDLPVIIDGQQNFHHSIANYISKHFYLVRRYTRIPVIFHVQLATLASTTVCSDTSSVEEVYFDLLHHGLRLSPEYLCVDITCSDKRIRTLMASKGSTKIIGQYFEPHPELHGWTSEHRKQMLKKIEKFGCDLVRICQNATSMADNISAQQFANGIKISGESHRPLIAYNTGRLGRMSCCFNTTLTPVTHTLLRALEPTSSLLTIKEAQTALYASYRLDALSFSVLGSNIAFSLAPAMYNTAFKFCGIPHEYKLAQCSSLENVKSVIHDPYFGGASVTFPYKRDIIPFVNFMSPDARAIGAVNTLVPLRSVKSDSILHRNRAGLVVGIYGENTDWIGIHTSISQNLSPANAVKQHTTAVVLGAGGMARAAIYALIRLGVRNIFIQNRTRARAEEVAQQFNDLPATDNPNLAPLLPRDGATISTTSGVVHSKLASKIQVISSLVEQWPDGFDPPTVLVSCVPPQSVGGAPPANITVPTDWLTSKTGGVVVEVCSPQ